MTRGFREMPIQVEKNQGWARRLEGGEILCAHPHCVPLVISHNYGISAVFIGTSSFFLQAIFMNFPSAISIKKVGPEDILGLPELHHGWKVNVTSSPFPRASRLGVTSRPAWLFRPGNPKCVIAIDMLYGCLTKPWKIIKKLKVNIGKSSMNVSPSINRQFSSWLCQITKG